MSQRVWIGAVVVWGLLGGGACEKQAPITDVTEGGPVAARFEGGMLTVAEVERESRRLPPALRAKFETGPGRREFIRSLVDKRLLALEAARQGLTATPEIRRQVRELEERLSIEALLAAEEHAAAAPTEAEARAFHEAHVERFAEPERLRVARVLVSVASGSTKHAWEQARARADGFRKRLLAGEPVGKVAVEGEGPERIRGGDLGLLARGELGSEPQERAALALTKVGAVSGVVESSEGVLVLVLLDRRPARVPAFEEVRAAVLGQMRPGGQRKVLSQVLTRLRTAAHVKLEEGDATTTAAETSAGARR
ncbi:hypothetical protein FJV41_34615 [Myxococcus llanfairpwllgwyngyllgogerychwyrndrobwllllantysiliogogogochensis]|uniref:PpiC domain-containing protein n=1 Tax=Myxococcus llanfairpwllgwyngyllgogerychwyrndrobwllllantysiliogogogochensis TaxID=2590453 RepID=A0A540WSJ7_9BACT|nr:hypothetical protein FJV41_34615 [Myxococcus llanfairpwllgwyngyllgogerychwyrndrobwllllantysiliogogogochensis]